MYVLLGANGNISSKIARILLAQGNPVRVVGRSATRIEPLARLGAEPAVGDVADSAFLTEALRGARAVFAMVPPSYAATQPLAESARMGEAIANAIVAAGVKRVVNLSSIGAHLATGTGPIVGLHAQEARLNQIEGVSILHLRPGYFFENHLNAIGVIKAHGIYSDMIAAHTPVPSIATADIAVVAARALALPHAGADKQVLHLRSAELYTPKRAAAILGQAIGIADLEYARADPAQAKAGMVQHGISPAMADLFEEMANAMGRPEFAAEMIAGPTEITPTRLEQFAPSFKAAFDNVPAHAAGSTG